MKGSIGKTEPGDNEGVIPSIKNLNIYKSCVTDCNIPIFIISNWNSNNRLAIENPSSRQ
ncbi:MAG: hypothetical protein HON27_13250 [Candidatus Marinimicrobia bacterium]|nr:hypothetical protein [Candidatus Neomarinimicrobiota bacterium]